MTRRRVGPRATAALILVAVVVVAAVVLGVGIGYLRSQEPRSPSASDVSAVESSLAAKSPLPQALDDLRRTIDEAQSALEEVLGVTFNAVAPPSRSALAPCPGDLASATRARVAADAERRADVTLTDAQWETVVSAVARALGPRAENDRGRTPYLAGFTVADVGEVRLTRTVGSTPTVELMGTTECRLP